MSTLKAILSRYAAIGAQFLTIAIVTRSLPLEDAGIYFALFGLVQSTYVIAGTGIPDGVVRTVPAMRALHQESQARGMLLRGMVLSLLSSLSMAALLGLGYAVVSGDYKLALVLVAWWLAYAAVFVCGQFLVADERVALGSSVFYSFVNFGVLALVVGYTMNSNAPSLGGVLKATVVGALVAAFAGVSVLLTKVDRSLDGALPSLGEMRPIWQTGLPVMLARFVMALVIWSPVWICGWFLGLEDAAMVALATRLLSAVAALLAAVRFSVRPVLARQSALGDWNGVRRTVVPIARWTTILALVALGLTLSLGDRIISFGFGDSYVGMGLVTGLFISALVVECVGGPIDEALKMSGSARTLLIIQTTWLFIGTGLQILGAMQFGMVGIAVAYSCMICGICANQIVHIYRTRGVLLWAFARA